MIPAVRAALWAVVALFLAAPALSQGSGVTTPPPMAALFGGPFELADHNGRTRTDRDFPGKYLLINFGYTHCPDICPTSLGTMAETLDRLEAAGQAIQPLFITIDPERDTGEVLKDYVPNFHPRLIGLRGTEAQTKAVAKAYRVHRSKLILDDAPAEDYLVNHSSLTFLMAPNGDFLTMFPYGSQPEFMATTIRRYLGKSGQS